MGVAVLNSSFAFVAAFLLTLPVLALSSGECATDDQCNGNGNCITGECVCNLLVSGDNCENDWTEIGWFLTALYVLSGLIVFQNVMLVSWSLYIMVSSRAFDSWRRYYKLNNLFLSIVCIGYLLNILYYMVDPFGARGILPGPVELLWFSMLYICQLSAMALFMNYLLVLLLRFASSSFEEKSFRILLVFFRAFPFVLFILMTMCSIIVFSVGTKEAEANGQFFFFALFGSMLIIFVCPALFVVYKFYSVLVYSQEKVAKSTRIQKNISRLRFTIPLTTICSLLLFVGLFIFDFILDPLPELFLVKHVYYQCCSMGLMIPAISYFRQESERSYKSSMGSQSGASRTKSQVHLQSVSNLSVDEATSDVNLGDVGNQVTVNSEDS